MEICILVQSIPSRSKIASQHPFSSHKTSADRRHGLFCPKCFSSRDSMFTPYVESGLVWLTMLIEGANCRRL